MLRGDGPGGPEMVAMDPRRKSKPPYMNAHKPVTRNAVFSTIIDFTGLAAAKELSMRSSV